MSTPSTRRVAALAAIAALVGSILTFLAPGTAGADINGVNYVNFDPNPYYCDQLALPTCLPDHGIGKSNTLYIHQELVDGEYRFTHVSGTSIFPDDVWMQTTFSAQCRTRFRLNWAEMDPGGVSSESGSPNGSGTGNHDALWPQPVNQDNRTIPERNVALHQSIDNVLAQWDLTTDDLLEWGEQRVADSVADGATLQDARTAVWDDLTFHYIVSANVGCRQISGMYAWLDNVEWKQVARGMPIQFVFLGAGMEPGDEDDPNFRDVEIPGDEPTLPQPASDDLREEFRVNDLTLFALEDEADACLLHLSGVVQTNGPGEVTYRFVNELGVKSQQFSVQVDQTQTAFLDHEIELDPIVLDGGLEPAGGGEVDQLVTDEGDGGIGGYAQEEGDNVQGYFFIEVSAPHGFESNIASYNIDGCTTGGTAEIPGTRDAEDGTQEIDLGGQEYDLGGQTWSREGLGG